MLEEIQDKKSTLLEWEQQKQLLFLPPINTDGHLQKRKERMHSCEI